MGGARRISLSRFSTNHPFLDEELPRIQSAALRYRVPLRGNLELPLIEFQGTVLLLKILDLFSSGWNRVLTLDFLRSRIIAAPVAEISRFVSRFLQSPDRRLKKPWEYWVRLAQDEKADELAAQLRRWGILDQEASAKMTGSEFADWAEKLADAIQDSRALLASQAEDRRINDFEDAGWKSLRGAIYELNHFVRRPRPRSELIELFRRSLAAAKFPMVVGETDAIEISSGRTEDHLPIPVMIYLSLHSRVPAPEKVNPFLNESASPSYSEQLSVFKLQLANAQQRIILSCPRHDDNGDELTSSPFLNSLPDLSIADKAGEALLQQALRWRPHSALSPRLRLMTKDAQADVFGRAQSKPSRQILKQASRIWSASRFANAIQCLYLHFAADVLRLRPQADAMIEAAAPAMLGRLAHRILQEYVAKMLRGEDYDIAQQCQEQFREMTAVFPPHLETDRAEEELLLSLTHFAKQGWEKLAADFHARTDRLELAFGEGKRYPAMMLEGKSSTYTVDGIIDRLDQSAEGRALIIEYKYRKAESESEEDFYQALQKGKQPQLPLYALAVEHLMGLQAAGLIQIYLRSAVIRGLKMQTFTPLFDESDLRSISADDVQQMTQAVRSLLSHKAGMISAGVLTAFPEEFESCGPGACAYADLCRYRGKSYDADGRKD